jgi:hypothetical protein
MRRRTLAIFAVLAVLLVPALALLIDAAGHRVAVAVAVAALAALAASYVRIWRLTVRSLGAENAKERLERAGLAHMLIMLSTPLIVIAAHPWGTATFVVAGGVLLLQPLFLHATIVAGLIRQRRAGKTRPS